MLVFWWEIFKEFMANHTYYNEMFASMNNRWLIIWAVVSAGIPLLYLVKNKKFSLRKFTIYLFLWLLLFSFIHLIVNDSFISKWFLLYIINILILFVLWAYFLVWLLALWTWISKFIKYKWNWINELFLKFGIWLWAFLILVQTLVWLKLFYSVTAWIIFLWLGFLIWYVRSDMKENWNIISQALSSLRQDSPKLNRWKWILIALVLFSIVYYLYWFQLSFIPYSTAWDANHAYMYWPKVILQNHWINWWAFWDFTSMQYLWYMFITFWFGIWSVFSGGWLSPDTIAVAMNFLSWPMCLIIGIVLINEVISFFSEKMKLSDNWKNISFATWWMTLLLWLTSWMWAFLVFVDNKTDLWVMAITLLAMLSGFIFIRYIEDSKSKKMFDKESLKYLITSWVLFALAGMAKPSAFIDVVILGLILVWLWLNTIISIWLWVIMVWMMWVMQLQNAHDFMWTDMWIHLVIIWWIICIIWLISMILRNKKNLKDKKILFTQIAIWGLSFVAAMLLLKWPWVLYSQIINHDFSIGWFWKWLLLSYDMKLDNKNTYDSKNLVLLAQNSDVDTLEDQNAIDRAYLEWSDEYTAQVSEPEVTNIKNNEKTIDQCSASDYWEDDDLYILTKTFMPPEEINEDVWRYVWYWWKEFWTNKNSLTYSILKLFYPKDGKCYWANKDAVILCENQSAIEKGDIETLKTLKLKEWTPIEKKLREWLAAYEENEDTLMDLITRLQLYYQNHSIYRENGHIYMPYRYIVPLNITFNWSLQNLSSYYTDIWFIWIFIFIITILAFIYSIIRSDKRLFALSLSTIVGRAIWRVVGWWILWYWVWLITWTLLVVAIFMGELLWLSDNKKNIRWYVTIWLLALWMILQLFFNLIRISSQWSSWPFLWFKQSAWTVQEITNTLWVNTETKLFYSQKDVFDLQFPHYNKFIEHVKDRKDTDWVFIAWTYLQYFLKNQKNIKIDWSMYQFWNAWNWVDLCLFYQRLKHVNIKYLVIDPNIVSIVMWDWNKSLFYRFFAKVNEDWKIIEKWSMFMLAELIKNWYAELMYSNNIGATYAFTLTDEEMKSIFGDMSDDDLTYLRIQLADARYMDNANELINAIAQIFTARVANWQAISDIADVYGKIVDPAKIVNAVNVYISSPQSLSTIVDTLTQDERYVLLNYLQIYSMSQQSNSSQYSEVLNTILSNSLAGGSQLMVFELK